MGKGLNVWKKYFKILGVDLVLLPAGFSICFPEKRIGVQGRGEKGFAGCSRSQNAVPWKTLRAPGKAGEKGLRGVFQDVTGEAAANLLSPL